MRGGRRGTQAEHRRDDRVPWPWLGLAGLTLALIISSASLLFLHIRGGVLSPGAAGRALLMMHVVSLALGLGLCAMALVRDRQRRRVERVVLRQKNILQSILDNLGDGVAVADKRGRLLMFNPAAERILGLGLVDSGPEEWSKVYGLFLPDTVTPVPVAELPLSRAVAGHESRDVELFVRNPKLQGGVFIRVTATPLRDQAGLSHGGVAVFRDITDRKWAEAILRDSEARFKSIVQATGTALIILSPDKRILEFNPEAERITGRPRADVLGEDYFELFLPAAYRAVVALEIEKALTGRSSSSFEHPLPAQTGEDRLLLWNFSHLTNADGEALGVIATGHDITERREAEEALRVRQLAGHLQSAREGERAHIAREIHDELGQALTGLKFEVSHLSRQLGGEAPDVHERFGSIQRLIDATIASVRRMASDLRPQILDELGLLEAIRWQAAQFEKRTGITCELDLPGDDMGWSAERSTAMFRILQESLTNVARHAAATRVAVKMTRRNGNVVLEVSDDGRGIKESELAGASSFGLLSMQERARIFGGALSVRGGDPGGTVVTLVMPD